MSLQILQCEADVTAARVELDRRGLSCLRVRMPREGLLGSLFGLSHMEVMGDVRKSWDVLGMAHLIEQGVPRDARVLDIGAFKSEILPVLYPDTAAIGGIDVVRVGLFHHGLPK